MLLSLTGNYANMNAWLKSYNLVAVPPNINSGIALSKNKLIKHNRPKSVSEIFLVEVRVDITSLPSSK